MLVLAGKHGQLANRLTLVSYFILLSRQTCVPIVAPILDEYAPYFSSTKDDPFCFLPRGGRALPAARRIRHWVYRASDVVSRVLVKIPLGRRLVAVATDAVRVDVASPAFMTWARTQRFGLVRGWFFVWNRLLDQADVEVLRTFFDPVPEIKATVRKRVNDARADRRPLVGVHLRRGDYAQWRGGRYLFELSAYIRLMWEVVHLLQRRGQCPTFLLCSNEAISKEDFSDFDVTVAGGSDVEDLWCLSECDLILGPPSTYSQWASLIGNVPLYLVEDLSEEVTYEKFVCVRYLRPV